MKESGTVKEVEEKFTNEYDMEFGSFIPFV
ncbi:hypothetical protein PAECIP111894_00678 [Paenibacillus pseudetheri]|uniref:Uncharacterized protein n=1 Tax=Paenibacillus pseudetheri TaxID=2897682 RepID=A0ABN8F982_9BACL|nr:hypothetical protein PAECIP111894_00678 [Paenibacillus pseudetheri]